MEGQAVRQLVPCCQGLWFVFWMIALGELWPRTIMSRWIEAKKDHMLIQVFFFKTPGVRVSLHVPWLFSDYRIHLPPSTSRGLQSRGKAPIGLAPQNLMAHSNPRPRRKQTLKSKAPGQPLVVFTVYVKSWWWRGFLLEFWSNPTCWIRHLDGLSGKLWKGIYNSKTPGTHSFSHPLSPVMVRPSR